MVAFVVRDAHHRSVEASDEVAQPLDQLATGHQSSSVPQIPTKDTISPG